MPPDSEQHGRIAWADLTAPDAERLKDFYAAVVDWQPSPVDMGGYADFAMHPPGGEPVAGVCHARGPHADLPPVWLIYITVADLDASLARCRAHGGTVLAEPRVLGSTGRYAVIRDPAGAVAALHQATS